MQFENERVLQVCPKNPFNFLDIIRLMIKDKTMKNIIGLVVYVGISELAGVIGAIFTTPNIAGWYASLTKPVLMPPAWLFGPVWTFLYFLMGIALFLVWRRGWKTAGVKEAVGVFVIQLVLNILWSVIFFGLHAPLAAFIAVIALWIAIVATIMAFGKISHAAMWALLPYLLWVTFAAYLNLSIWLLN